MVKHRVHKGDNRLQRRLHRARISYIPGTFGYKTVQRVEIRLHIRYTRGYREGTEEGTETVQGT